MTAPPRTSEPLVSVVIPAYNAARFIRDTLESALAQTYPRVEVIVVDDGSTDGTAGILRGYGARIRYIRQDNQGVAVARNRGIEAARGELIAFLDADDVWLPEKLASQVAEHAVHPEAGLITCGTYYIDEYGTVFDERKPPPYPDRQRAYETLLIRNIIFGGPSTVMVPKRCLDTVGPFDPMLVSREDWELWIRIVRCFPIRTVDGLLSRYRVHANNKHRRMDYTLRCRAAIIKAHRASMSWTTSRKAWSYLYGDVAEEYYDMGRKDLACRYTVKAIMSYPLKVWPKDAKYTVAVKSALPRWVLGVARSLRQRLKGGGIKARRVSP